MNVNELVIDVASAKPTTENIVTTLPESGEMQITIPDIMGNMQFKDKSMFSLFVRSAVNLKTNINRIVEKEQAAKEGRKFNARNVEIGKINAHALILITALKLYTERFTDKYGVDMCKFVNDRLASKQDELIFTGFNVNFDASEANKVNEVVDALCVKFYEEAILSIVLFLASHGKAHVVNTDNNIYTFKFRNFNIMERDMVAKGKIPTNLRE